MIDLLCSLWIHSYSSPAPWTKCSILLTELSSKLRRFTQWQPTSLYLIVTKSSDTESMSDCLDACLHLLHSGLFTSPILNVCPFKLYCPLCSPVNILRWFMLRLSSSPGYFKKALACLCPHLDCWCTSRFLLVQSLITPLATFADIPSTAPIRGCVEPCPANSSAISFPSISTCPGTHTSWILFCQFDQGLIAVPG